MRKRTLMSGNCCDVLFPPRFLDPSLDGQDSLDNDLIVTLRSNPCQCVSLIERWPEGRIDLRSRGESISPAKKVLWKFCPSLNCKRNRNRNLFSLFIVDGFGCLNWVQHPRQIQWEFFEFFICFHFIAACALERLSVTQPLYWGDHADCVCDLRRNTFRACLER